RSWQKDISELQKIQCGHGLENAYLLVDKFQDLADPLQFMDHLAHVVRIVVDSILDKDVPHQVELKKDLLEPKFINLMDDNEEHLIIAFFHGLKTFGMLAVQDLIKSNIFRVIEVFHGDLLTTLESGKWSIACQPLGYNFEVMTSDYTCPGGQCQGSPGAFRGAALRIKALIFDFDGLILDTETPEYQVWQAIYSENGFELPHDKWEKIIGGAGLSNFDAAEHLSLLSQGQLDSVSLRDRFRSESHTLIHTQSILPGVMDYIHEAKRLGLKLAVAS